MDIEMITLTREQLTAYFESHRSEILKAVLNGYNGGCTFQVGGTEDKAHFVLRIETQSALHPFRNKVKFRGTDKFIPVHIKSGYKSPKAY